MYSFIYKTLTKDYLSVSVSYYMKSHTKHELKLGSGWDLSLTCSFSAVYRSERDHRGRPDGGATHVLPGWRPAVPAARRAVPQPGQSGWTGGSDCGPLHTVSYRDIFFLCLLSRTHLYLCCQPVMHITFRVKVLNTSLQIIASLLKMTEMIINRQVLWPRSWYLKMDYSVWNLILCSLQLCAITLPYINIYLFNICGGFSPGAMVPNLTVGYPMNRHKSNNVWQKIFRQDFYHKYAVIIMMIHYSWYNDDNEVSVCTSNPCQQKTASNALVQFFFSFSWLFMMSLRADIKLWSSHRHLWLSAPPTRCYNFLFARGSQSEKVG